MKNYHLALLIILLSQAFPSFSQEVKPEGRGIYDKILEQAPENLKTRYPLELNRISAGLCNLLVNYMHQEPELGLDASDKSYVKQVLNKVLGFENEHIKVVFCRGSHVGFVEFIGDYLIVDVGNLHLLANEGVFAAALARAYGLHKEQSLLKAAVGMQTGKISTENFREEKKFNRESNAVADSIALVLMNSSGYGISSLLEYIRTHEHHSHKYAILTSPREQPYVDYWLARNRKWLEGQGPMEQQQFIVSEERFYAVQDKAIKKVLDYLFVEGQYTQQLILAFKYHLFYPEDADYILHILKANRHSRLLLLGQYYPSEVDNLNFISSLQLIADQSRPVTETQPYPLPIFERFNTAIFNTRPQQAKRIKASNYWQEKPFTTEAEAFNFFIDKLKSLGNPEAYLEQALRTRNEDERHLFLQEYLGQTDIKFGAFAKAYTSGADYDLINDRTAILGGGIQLLIVSKDAKIQILDRGTDFWKQYWVDSAFQSLGDTLMSLDIHCNTKDQLLNKKIRNYFDYVFLYHSRYSKFHEEFEFLEYHLPEFWNLFKEFNCSEFILLEGSISGLSKARKDPEVFTQQFLMSSEAFLVEPKVARTLNYTKLRLDLKTNYKLRSANRGSMNGSGKIHPLEQLKNIFVGMPLN